MTRPSSLTTTATALAIFGALTLAGCSTPPEPSNLETPNVAWPDGEPFGQFADDPAAQVINLWLVNEALAWTARDYSDADLVQAIGMKSAQSRVDDLENALRAESTDKFTQLGPDPYLVLGVIAQEGVSTVISCTYASRDKVDSRQVFVETVTFRDDGTATLDFAADLPASDKSLDDYRAECEDSDIPVGYFDPAPEPQTDRDAKVKGPAAADKYNLD